MNSSDGSEAKYAFITFIIILVMIVFIFTNIATNVCCQIFRYTYFFREDSLFQIYNRPLFEHLKLKKHLKADSREFINDHDLVLSKVNSYDIVCTKLNEKKEYKKSNDDLSEICKINSLSSLEKDRFKIDNSLGKLDKFPIKLQRMV